jgi:hypothetical protein
MFFGADYRVYLLLPLPVDGLVMLPLGLRVVSLEEEPLDPLVPVPVLVPLLMPLEPELMPLEPELPLVPLVSLLPLDSADPLLPLLMPLVSFAPLVPLEPELLLAPEVSSLDFL